MTTSFESVLSRFYWTLLLRGFMAILFGVLTLFWPGVTLSVLVLLFGVYVVIDGIAAIVLGIREYGDRERWWAPLLGGIVGVAAGLIALASPAITALALLILIGSWAIVRGVFDIVAAIRLRQVIEGEWWLALGGALSIAFGVFVIVFPGAGALAVATWIGIFAIALGIMLVMLGFRVQGIGRRVRA